MRNKSKRERQERQKKYPKKNIKIVRNKYKNVIKKIELWHKKTRKKQKKHKGRIIEKKKKQNERERIKKKE